MVCRGVYIPQDDDSMVPDPQSNGHWCKTYQPHDLNDLVWQSNGWTLVGVLGSHLVNQLAIGCFKTWTFEQNMRFESTKWRETTETTANFFFIEAGDIKWYQDWNHLGMAQRVWNKVEQRDGHPRAAGRRPWSIAQMMTHTHNCVQRHAKIDIFFTFYNVHKHCHSLWQIFAFDLLSLIPLSLKTGLLFPPICQNREKHNLESEGLSWCKLGWLRWGMRQAVDHDQPLVGPLVPDLRSLVGEYPHDWKGCFYPHASLGWYQYFYCRSISHDWLVICPLSLDVSMVCVTD